MLKLDGVEVRVGTFTLRADFTVAGGLVAVLGPSGGGKSTLLDTIAGFAMPRAGRVLWQGEDLTGRTPAERPIATLFQDNNLFPHLTVAQNIGLGIRPNLRLSEAEWGAVDAALDTIGMAGFGARKPAELSGGQVARVALARAFVQDKALLLLDEPFGALDPALRAEMLTETAGFARARGATMLMVTHNPEDARQVANQVIFVAGGVAQAPVETAEFFAAPPPELAGF